MQAFVAPLAPFVDPDSLVSEDPERHGYRLRAGSLEDHCCLIDSASTWKDVLNYETFWMSRNDVARAYYGALRSLMRVRLERGLVGEETHAETVERIEDAESRRERSASAAQARA